MFPPVVGGATPSATPRLLPLPRCIGGGLGGGGRGRPCKPPALGMSLTVAQRTAENAVEEWMCDSAYELALDRTT